MLRSPPWRCLVRNKVPKISRRVRFRRSHQPEDADVSAVRLALPRTSTAERCQARAPVPRLQKDLQRGIARCMAAFEVLEHFPLISRACSTLARRWHIYANMHFLMLEFPSSNFFWISGSHLFFLPPYPRDERGKSAGNGTLLGLNPAHINKSHRPRTY